MPDKPSKEQMKIELMESVQIQMTALKKSLVQSEVVTVDLTRNLFAIIDKEMAQEVNRFNWHANVQPEHIHARKFKGGLKTLQQFIAELHASEYGKAEQIKQVTFKNKISLDCRVSNINIGYGRQAVMRNRKGKRNCTSEYKGVHWSTKPQKWKASIADTKIDLKVHLGLFEDEIEAAMIYDAAAIVMFEKSSLLNFKDNEIKPEVLQAAEARIEARKQKIANNGG